MVRVPVWIPAKPRTVAAIAIVVALVLLMQIKALVGFAMAFVLFNEPAWRWAVSAWNDYRNQTTKE
jgi:hypothetical protein